MSRECDEYLESVNQVLRITQPFYEGGLTLERIHADLTELKDVEKKLKSSFTKLLDEKIIGLDSHKELFTKMNEFVSKDYAYFISSQFVDLELNELRELSVKVYHEFNEYRFQIYKNLLEEQLSVVGVH